jgi:hypothetical protein
MAKGSANAITLPNLKGNAGALTGLNNNLASSNLYPGLTPEYSGLAQGVVNNPGNAGATAGAAAGANIGAGAATGAADAGSALTGISQQLLPYATDILQTGFDPQQALYDRTAQQTQQQERAAESARGVAMTPYGAGLEGDVMKNFNIDWQNNQLNRETTAAGAAGGLTGAAGGAATSGLNLGSGASQLAASSAALPMNTNNAISGSSMGALDSLGNFGGKGAAIPQEMISNILSDLGLGPGYAQAQTASRDAQNPMMAIAPILGQVAGGAAGNSALGGK